MALSLHGCKITPGRVRGEVLVTLQPISFWGGVDPASGRIIDPRHELFEQVGKAPAAIINVHTEPILATGPVVSRIFYGQSLPMMTLAERDFALLSTGQRVLVNADNGVVEIED